MSFHAATDVFVHDAPRFPGRINGVEFIVETVINLVDANVKQSIAEDDAFFGQPDGRRLFIAGSATTLTILSYVSDVVGCG